MNRSLVSTLTVLLLACVSASGLRAGPTDRSLDRPDLPKPGRTIRAVHSGGAEITGILASWDADSLRLERRSGRTAAFAASDLDEVWARTDSRGHRRKVGRALGALAGGATGIILAVSMDNTDTASEDWFRVSAIPMGIMGGFVFGHVVGALWASADERWERIVPSSPLPVGGRSRESRGPVFLTVGWARSTDAWAPDGGVALTGAWLPASVQGIDVGSAVRWAQPGSGEDLWGVRLTARWAHPERPALWPVLYTSFGYSSWSYSTGRDRRPSLLSGSVTDEYLAYDIDLGWPLRSMPSRSLMIQVRHSNNLIGSDGLRDLSLFGVGLAVEWH